MAEEKVELSHDNNEIITSIPLQQDKNNGQLAHDTTSTNNVKDEKCIDKQIKEKEEELISMMDISNTNTYESLSKSSLQRKVTNNDDDDNESNTKLIDTNEYNLKKDEIIITNVSFENNQDDSNEYSESPKNAENLSDGIDDIDSDGTVIHDIQVEEDIHLNNDNDNNNFKDNASFIKENSNETKVKNRSKPTMQNKNESIVDNKEKNEDQKKQPSLLTRFIDSCYHASNHHSVTSTPSVKTDADIESDNNNNNETISKATDKNIDESKTTMQNKNDDNNIDSKVKEEINEDENKQCSNNDDNTAMSSSATTIATSNPKLDMLANAFMMNQNMTTAASAANALFPMKLRRCSSAGFLSPTMTLLRSQQLKTDTLIQQKQQEQQRIQNHHKKRRLDNNQSEQPLSSDNNMNVMNNYENAQGATSVTLSTSCKVITMSSRGRGVKRNRGRLWNNTTTTAVTTADLSIKINNNRNKEIFTDPFTKINNLNKEMLKNELELTPSVSTTNNNDNTTNSQQIKTKLLSMCDSNNNQKQHMLMIFGSNKFRECFLCSNLKNIRKSVKHACYQCVLPFCVSCFNLYHYTDIFLPPSSPSDDNLNNNAITTTRPKAAVVKDNNDRINNDNNWRKQIDFLKKRKERSTINLGKKRAQLNFDYGLYNSSKTIAEMNDDNSKDDDDNSKDDDDNCDKDKGDNMHICL